MAFDYTVATEKSIEQSITDLTAALKEGGFGVLGILDFQELLRQKGVELGREYRLLEVCNPKAAKGALDKDPKVGLLLPCTIAIYVDGSITRISLLRPSMLLNLIPESNSPTSEQRLKKNSRLLSTRLANPTGRSALT
jgi:uncharacterized protein (DUF302 family)